MAWIASPTNPRPAWSGALGLMPANGRREPLALTRRRDLALVELDAAICAALLECEPIMGVRYTKRIVEITEGITEFVRQQRTRRFP
jgi:hypothetical protein